MDLNAFAQSVAAIDLSAFSEPVRLSPLFFEGEPPVLFPRLRRWAWRSLTAALESAGASACTGMLPLLWQTEPLAFAACRAARVPFFALDEGNAAVAARAVDTAGLDTILIREASAVAVANDFAEHNDRFPTNWILVREFGAAAVSEMGSIETSQRLFREIHLFPGVPLLVQCEARAAAHDASRFHLAPGLSIRHANGATLVSSDGDLPFTDLTIDELAPAGTCECGESLLSL